MSLFIASLNSGSNGNCYYVGNGKDAVLIDAGISCREVERRMRLLDLSMRTIRAVFISHEHTDHIRGITALSRRYQLPVYITAATHDNRVLIDKHLIVNFNSGDKIDVEGLQVTAFSKHHDANDPQSFVVEGNGTTIGVFTDIGIACDQLTYHFSKCHAAFLEANYDIEMLENGPYPIYLKNRIRGGKGHLSNCQALEVFCSHRPAHMTHLLLAHLSKDNNDPGKALELFAPYRNGVNISVASRYEPSQVYHINADSSHTSRDKAVQTSLFG